MKKSTRLLAALLSVAGVVVATTPSTTLTARQVKARAVVYRLASNDGRWERSAGPQWIVKSGDDLATVSRGIDVTVPSGTLLEFSSSSAPSGEVGAAAFRRAKVRGRVSGAGVIANRRLVVVPVEWPTAQWKPADLAIVDSIVAELKPWWNSMSARQETLSVTVTDKLDLDAVLPAGSCDIAVMMDKVKERIAGLGLAYDHAMATFTGDNQDCSFGGLAAIGGKESWTYADAGNAGVWAHELGHNLGFSHGNICWSGVTLTYMETCTDVEYGNTTDVMGLGVGLTGYFSPQFLDSTGWLPAANQALWPGASTTYSLVRADRSDLGVTAVKINPADASAGDNGFWLQYNPSTFAFADSATRGTNGGVILTMRPTPVFVENLVSSDGAIGEAKTDSYLCDITPSASQPDGSADMTTDPRLFAGQSWTDPRNRFTVTVVATDGTTATVRVDAVATATVATPTDIAIVPDEGGADAVDVVYSPPASVRGANEPVSLEMSIVENPALTCTATAMSPTCRFEGLARQSNYTVKVVSKNGFAASAEYKSAPFNLSLSPPHIDATFEATDTTLTAVATVDTGGTALTEPATLSVGTDQVCTLDPSAPTTCTFVGLPRRAQQEVVARAVNGLGPRTTTFTPQTTAGKPDGPVMSGEFVGSDLVVSLAPGPDDISNIDHAYLECSGGGMKWKSTVPVVAGAAPKASVRISKSKGFALYCFGAAISLAARGFLTSNYSAMKVSKAGKLDNGKVALTSAVKSTKKGQVLVSWKTKDSFGGKVAVEVTAKKKCKPSGKNACVISGLTSGETIQVAVLARGTSGSKSERKSVVVK